MNDDPTGPANERSVTATVTYLTMDTRPTAPPPPRPLLKSAIFKADEPPVHFYRYLYNEVGRDYYWVERRNWNDEEIAALLADENMAFYVLYIGGVPAGFAELDFRDPVIGQIAYFGLVPEFVGRRIGPWFLSQTVDLAWAAPIEKLRVSTCALDHKKALSTYQRAGFSPYARGEKTIFVPLDLELPAPSS